MLHAPVARSAKLGGSGLLLLVAVSGSHFVESVILIDIILEVSGTST